MKLPIFTHLIKMTFVVKQNEATNSVNISLLSAIGVAACKHKRSDLQTGEFSAQIKALPQFW
jgi:hypothetical protein